MANKEVWKPVVGYEGLYSVSNFGNIRSEGVLRGTVSGKLLKPQKWGRGYLYISLYKNQKPTTKKIHRLVLESFVGKRKKGIVSNHKNGNKQDNRLCNLEYCTVSQNGKHAFDTGLRISQKGEECGRAKLNEKDVIKIRKLYKTGKYMKKDIAEMFNITPTNVYSIVNKKSWKHVK